MTKRLKIGVLFGGPSAEHEVSLATAKNVITNLNPARYSVLPIKISKNCHWIVGGKNCDIKQALKSCDILFNALHGSFGEDGTLQAILEYHGAKYTGSGIAASALAMDKLRSREIFKLAGFNVPKTLKIKKSENYQARLNLFINKIVRMPLVVKPCSNGSSIGVKIVKDDRQLKKAIGDAFKFDKKVLIEEFIPGREITCGVVDDFNGQDSAALPVTEIIPSKKHKFFNYDAKYRLGHCSEVTPAQIDETVYIKAQEIAVRAHQLLGCRSYSRTDMILKNGNDTIYVLETNTLPGLTATSLIPQAAKCVGLTFSQLLDKIIESSL